MAAPITPCQCKKAHCPSSKLCFGGCAFRWAAGLPTLGKAAAVLGGVLVQNITCDVEEVNADQVNEAIVSPLAQATCHSMALQIRNSVSQIATALL